MRTRHEIFTIVHKPMEGQREEENLIGLKQPRRDLRRFLFERLPPQGEMVAIPRRDSLRL